MTIQAPDSTSDFWAMLFRLSENLLCCENFFSEKSLQGPCPKCAKQGECYCLIFVDCLKGKFSSGIEGALASTLNRDFNWKQLSEMILCIFSSPEPKARVSYCRPFSSVVRRPSSVNFLHFHLLLENAWLDFNQTWQESSLGVGDSKLSK